MTFPFRPLDVAAAHAVVSPSAVVNVETVSTAASGAMPWLTAVPHGSGTLRILLLLCALAFLVIAAGYAARNEDRLTAGHGLAGIGLTVAATVGDGAGVWVGITLAGGGGIILLRDARRRGRRTRPSL